MSSSATEHRTLWDEGTVDARTVLALAFAVSISALAVDLVLSPALGFLYDLCFITVCVAAALAVRPSDFFAVGTLPPLLMMASMVLLALDQPAAIADATDGLVQATVSGLAHHSAALAAGYALTLVILAIRRHRSRRR